MSASYQFRVALAGFLPLALLGLTSSVRAEETEIDLFPHGTAIVNNAKADFEAGFEYAFDDMRLRLVGKSPLTNPKGEDPLIQFDETTNAWRLATLFELEIDTTGEDDSIQHFTLGLTGEWGIKDYSYFLSGGDKKETVAKQSFSAGLRSAYYYSAGEFNACQFMPQLSFRYKRSWKAADKTGIVVPGDASQPSTVTDKIIKPPSVAPSMIARFSMPLYPGWAAPVAFGPSVAYGWSSKNEEWIGSDLQRARFEWWLYFFPKKGAVNTRLGLGPFLDVPTQDEDDTEERVYGLLVQLRVGVVPLEY